MKNLPFLFGCAYYPEYMPGAMNDADPRGEIKRDIEAIRDANMNVVRIAESTWSVLEPRKDEFNFTFVDGVLDEAERHGIYVIIGTPTYAVPSWLVREDPAVMAETKHGRNLYGGRQAMNIMHPFYRECAERVIRALLGHTARRKCVIGYQIDNETKHYGTSGEDVQRLFLEHLKKKFGTTDNFNEAFHLAYWSNSISDWEDMPDIRGTINGGLAAEFEAFQRSLAAEFLAWEAAIVREYLREGQFITHNLDFEWRAAAPGDIPSSYGVQPDSDHPAIARIVDIAGCDIYHNTQSALTGEQIAFCGDEVRCLKRAPYIVIETQAQGYKEWTPYPGQLRLQAFSHIASGARGVMYWHYHTTYNGVESLWRGVVSHDLEKGPAYDEIKTTGADIARLGRERLVIKKRSRVALVVDNRSLTALKYFPADSALSYNDVVRWMYDSLYEENIECDVVFADDLSPADYKVIIAPALYTASDALKARLSDFVKEGGTLIASFKSFFADEYASARPERQPARLCGCFGMHYSQVTSPKELYVNAFGGHYPASRFAELLVPDGAEVLASYEHKYFGRFAAVTKNAFGRGAAYYIGCFTEKDVLRAVFRDAIRGAGAAPDTGAKWPVVVRSGENEAGRAVHYILNYSGESAAFVCPYESATDILSGAAYKKGSPIPLGDWGVCILEED